MPLLYDEVEIDEWTETMLLTERFTPPAQWADASIRLSDGAQKTALHLHRRQLCRTVFR